jgi:hypothetical protein
MTTLPVPVVATLSIMVSNSVAGEPDAAIVPLPLKVPGPAPPFVVNDPSALFPAEVPSSNVRPQLTIAAPLFSASVKFQLMGMLAGSVPLKDPPSLICRTARPPLPGMTGMVTFSLVLVKNETPSNPLTSGNCESPTLLPQVDELAPSAVQLGLPVTGRTTTLTTLPNAGGRVRCRRGR